MYSIIKKLDGTYSCEGQLQDGTERWLETDLRNAVREMKTFAKVMNNTTIKKKDIAFIEETTAERITLKAWKP